MTAWTDLVDRFRKVGNSHDDLQKVFSIFCNELLQQVSSQNFIVPGVKCDPNPDHARVTLQFAGSEVVLVFNTAHPQGSSARGVITAYEVQEFPEAKFVELGKVTFDRVGQSSLRDEDDDPIFLNTDLGAVFVALHLFSKCIPN